MENKITETRRKVSYPIGDGKVMHLRQDQRIHSGALYIKRIQQQTYENGNSFVLIFVSNDKNETYLWKTIINGATVTENDLGVLFQ